VVQLPALCTVQIAMGENIGQQYPALKIFTTRIIDDWLEVEIPNDAYPLRPISKSGF